MVRACHEMEKATKKEHWILKYREDEGEEDPKQEGKIA